MIPHTSKRLKIVVAAFPSRAAWSKKDRFAVPFTLVQDFGQDQRRLDRIQRLAFVEHFVIGIRPAAEKIGNNIAGGKLGNNPRTKRVSRPVDRDKPDLGKFFAEFIEQRLRAVSGRRRNSTAPPSSRPQPYSPKLLAKGA